MKICEERETEEVKLSYSGLMSGDVFIWLCGTLLCVKLSVGYAYLVDGSYWDETVANPKQEVTRYPNACITLGDPE